MARVVIAQVDTVRLDGVLHTADALALLHDGVRLIWEPETKRLWWQGNLNNKGYREALRKINKI